ncbi:CoB--CoM heterodisulfide reductase iron-sulfur subunit A family protein [Candidatus Spongiihabitans sp.]|uniref:CoB--CoM heterodisulfide reductase iron-sulfur subunit A family protein n=1 Tax=Candidatus Spongiihabitans sp. TaxID=3101308 RepID=UPI003C6FCFD2
MTDIVATNETILVIGGGISGMTTALEAAECGKDVILIEKNPALGGRISQLYKYFPKLCRPSCGQEINLRRIKANKRLRVLTMAEIENLTGEAGNYTATIKIHPRYVKENCTACGACARAVTAQIDDPHNYGMSKIGAAYLPNNMAYPQRYVIDRSIVGTEQGEQAKAACPVDAIDLDMQEQSMAIKCGAVVFATGWRPYDAARIEPYGYGRYEDVITSVELERMMDPFGPTAGKLVCPSTGEEAKDIAFIQCAGSRDRNHLPHCSRICCMASLKQSTYLGEKYGDDEDAKATIYYIDIRTIDRFEDFERQVRQDKKVKFIKSKVANIVKHPESGKPVLIGVDTHGYHRYENAHDLVVLAVGMQPSLDIASITHTAHGIALDSSGFIELDSANDGPANAPANAHVNGVFGAGCASNPLDVNRSVQNATAAALRAIQVVNRVAASSATSAVDNPNQ